MCGGIASLLGQQSKSPYYLPLFHLGRISCYMVLGCCIGAALQLGLTESPINQSLAQYLSILLRLLASALLILTALYVAKLSFIIKHIEKLFLPLWSKIQPHTQKRLPVAKAKDALVLGFLWGFLPCGMIYTAIGWSAAQAMNWQAGLLMLAFGLGTSPSLFLAGSAQMQLQRHLQKNIIRYLLACTLIGFAVYSAIQPMSMLIQKTNPSPASMHQHHH